MQQDVRQRVTRRLLCKLHSSQKGLHRSAVVTRAQMRKGVPKSTIVRQRIPRRLLCNLAQIEVNEKIINFELYICLFSLVYVEHDTCSYERGKNDEVRQICVAELDPEGRR